MDKPLLICMTPIRNEAWVLQAFLKATSLWADHIIIADQCSTDGSREIALSFPKVILIDNNNPDFNEAERQKMLIEEARKIDGDKLLFGLDADEIFTANFKETDDWSKILKSRPGDVFWFRWANICPNQKEYWSPEISYPWLFHDDGKEPHGNYVRNMHSMRIPYPIEEKQMFYINDFKVLHLAYLNPARNISKMRFYKFVDFEMNKRSNVSLSRIYNVAKINEQVQTIPSNWIYREQKDSFDLFSLVDLNTTSIWFDKYIYDHIHLNGINNYNKLDIWDNSFLKEYKIKDSRSILIKIFHHYLQITQKFSNNLIIIFFDKLLRKTGL